MTVRDELTRLLVTAGFAPAARPGQASTADAFSIEMARVGRVTLVLQYIGDAVLGAVTLNLDESLGSDVAKETFTDWAVKAPSSGTLFTFEKIASYAIAWSVNSDTAATEMVRGVVDLVATLRDRRTGR